MLVFTCVSRKRSPISVQYNTTRVLSGSYLGYFFGKFNSKVFQNVYAAKIASSKQFPTAEVTESISLHTLLQLSQLFPQKFECHRRASFSVNHSNFIAVSTSADVDCSKLKIVFSNWICFPDLYSKVFYHVPQFVFTDSGGRGRFGRQFSVLE